MARAKFKTNKTFQESKPRTGGDDNKKLDDMVDTLKLPEKEYVSMRLIGPAIPYAQHWIEFHSSKGKDVNIPKICLAFDPETEDFDSDKKCPYCDGGNKASVAYLTNAIIRDLQENEPAKKGKPSDAEKKSGFKEKSSKCWTPVRVVRCTSTVASKFQNLSNANKVKDKKSGETVAKPLSDEKYGRDIQMLYDSKAAGAAKYDVQKGDERTPLTEEESEYLVWNIEGLFEPEELSRAKQEAEKFFGGKGKKGKDGEYDEEDDMPKGKKGKKAKDDYLDSDEDEPKGKKADSDEDEADSDDDVADSDADVDSDEDEPKSKKKGKKAEPKAKGKKKAADSDEDDDSGFSDSDEEAADSDEDEPKAKKKGKGKKADSDSDADDGDSDEDAEDSDEDEPKAKKGKAAKKGKKAADSDDDEEADSDEDEPKAKKGKGKEKPKAKGKKKAADSDDDDVDIDDLDDASDEDEPKAKKGKSKDKKAKGKKSKKDEDSDDDVSF